MDKLEGMQAFVEVVNHGGFAAAGRHLGLSRSVVNKLVGQLEESLKVRLLQRTTRKVSPTDTGRAYYERCVDILAEVAEAEIAIAQTQSEPKGTLRMNAPMSFGTMHLSEAIAQFMAQYPDIQVQLTLSDRFIDLIEEGFDITLRIATPPEDASLVTQPLATVERVICASKNYLEQHGTPLHPGELAAHDCLKYGQFATENRWKLVDEKGEETSVKVRCRGYANNGEILKDWAIAHLGIVYLPTFIVGEAIQSGQLTQILTQYCPPPLTAYLSYASNKHLSAKIQRLSTFLQEWFKHPNW